MAASAPPQEKTECSEERSAVLVFLFFQRLFLKLSFSRCFFSLALFFSSGSGGEGHMFGKKGEKKHA